MAVEAYASGIQTGTVASEVFLANVNAAGVYTFHADLSNLATGDFVELRVYQMILTGETAKVAYLGTAQGVQLDEVIFISVPISNELTDSQALRFSLKQTLGTARVFHWKVLKHT